MNTLRLRDLPVATRAGLSFLLLALLGGVAASGVHLIAHHENRDERPGLSMADLEGAYHGVRTTAPLMAALDRGHPEDLPAADRELLRQWLLGDRISEDYDNVDLGANAPAEILDRSCLSCHARSAGETGAEAADLPLEYWDDVRKLAFSRDVAPLDPEIVIASLHTHALGMGVLSLVVAGLALCTRWSPRILGLLILVSGAALFADLGSWLLARDMATLVPVIAVTGSMWMGSTSALALMSLGEMWLPKR